jgi:hypothetical protein
MLDLTVTEHPSSLDLYPLFGYCVAGWIGSSAKYGRRQEIARFLRRFGAALH